MKSNIYFFLYLSVILPSLAVAQRHADLSLQIVSPAGNSHQATMKTINFQIRIKNAGPSAIKVTDTIGLDLILDGDTLLNGVTQTRPFWKFTNNPVAVGDSVTLNQPMVYFSSFDNSTVNTCLYAYPLITPNDTLSDLALSNNGNCVSLIFSEATGVAGNSSNPQELIVTPNPADRNIKIQSKHEGEIEIRITDVVGHTCLHIGRYQAGQTIPIDNLPAGTYIVTAAAKGFVASNIRFVKR